MFCFTLCAQDQTFRKQSQDKTHLVIDSRTKHKEILFARKLLSSENIWLNKTVIQNILSNTDYF